MEGLAALRTFNASRTPTHTKPPWRMACMGLNVEGKCQNSHCEAFASRVRCHKGFGGFNVGEPLHCPLCHMATTATRIGFIGCQWRIEFEGSINSNIMWRTSSCQTYQRFGILNSSLVVTTVALPCNQIPDAERFAQSFEALNLAASTQ